MVRWTDSKVEDETMRRKRIILPKMKRIKKWIENVLKLEGSNADNALHESEAGSSNV